MKIENAIVFGFQAALRGMRNPLESWSKSDSTFYQVWTYPEDQIISTSTNNILAPEYPDIGPNDLKLARKLVNAGPEHRKFLRFIYVSVDFTLPRYIWQELDTYKVSTVRNSCSTMHKLGYRDLTEDDFEDRIISSKVLDELNLVCANYRSLKLLKQSTDHILMRLKSMLPEGFLQKATYSFNYETAGNIWHQRRYHKLPQWNTKEDNPKYSICKFIADLPYVKELIIDNE